jgi:SAM-dependent methyltransferase
MGLLNLETISELLACPRCKSFLVRTPMAYRCTSETCDLARDEAFPFVDRWPLLVDFEGSILRRDRFQTGPGSTPLTGQKRVTSGSLPRWARRFWRPHNREALRNIDILLTHAPGESPLVLVVGGGTVGNGVEALYACADARVIGFDVFTSQWTAFIADAHRIPLADGSVDAVVVQAVLEHVLDPAAVVSEIQRVLTPGGLVYAETPFLQHVHAGPYDFTRYTSSGHRYLFRAFTEIASGPVAGPGTELLWSIDHLVRGLTRSAPAGKIARGLFFWLRYLDRLVPRDFAMDSSSANFFLGRLSDHDLTPAEIVDYYQGAQKGRL